MLIFYNAGKGQKVVSFSFYGEMKSMYYEGIQENAESLEVKLLYSTVTASEYSGECRIP